MHFPLKTLLLQDTQSLERVMCQTQRPKSEQNVSEMFNFHQTLTTESALMLASFSVLKKWKSEKLFRQICKLFIQILDKERHGTQIQTRICE
jgi:hypothetical protein